MMKKLSLLLYMSMITIAAFAQLRLSKIFGDDMVLQRNCKIPVWGWAGKNESIVVRFHNQAKTTKADAAGAWRIDLDAEEAGGPYTLAVNGTSNITLNNVLIGDVWICSGQSNMEWPLSASKDAAKEIASANFPQIRHFKVSKALAETPKDDLLHTGRWHEANPENAGNFTAAGYFFARDLYNQLKVPIGLINTSWGGTDVETWTSRSAFEKSEAFRDMISSLPTINLEVLAKQRKETVLQRVQQLQGELPNEAAAAAWPSLDFDDNKWPHMSLPGLWERQSLPDLDGVVWFRKIIELREEDLGNAAELQLAMIDDNDQTYVNGIKVGSTNGHNIKRIYSIPAAILKAGKNIIAIRVEDFGGGGGVYGDGGDMKLIFSNHQIPLNGEWKCEVQSVQEGNNFINPNSFPTLLYNAMIHPLVPFAMKGATWYQGENNASRAFEYRKAFPLMINDWRQQWGQDFPFYYVQLASYKAANGNSQTGSTWAELREAQTMTLAQPNTGMAVTIDIGETNDIHPRNKQDVGHRLAAIALRDTYSKHIVAAGPFYQSMKTEGNKMILSFKDIGSGLTTTDKYGYVKGFEIAGTDQQFKYAKAFIEGDKIVVYQDAISSPVAVRYAWADDAGDANLYNKEGFPAVPFRSDSWKGITEGKKYRGNK